MGRILEKFLNNESSQYCVPYADSEVHFKALQKEDSDAIRCLTFKISNSIYQIGIRQGLNEEDIEELICDCLATFLHKVKEQKYIYQGYDPATFVIEIAKNKSNNYRRKSIKQQTMNLQEAESTIINEDFCCNEATEKLEILLTKLDSNCQKLIRLKYLEEYRDSFVITNKLTQYTTIDSLKNNRAKCFKKLVELKASVNF